jgi:hypothetical protein
MISVTSVTDRYVLQPTTIARHKKTLEWLSATVLWKREMAFFQKLLDQYAPRYTSEQDKQQVDHFQSIILYYKGELIDATAAKLRQHELRLAEALEKRDETKVQYFSEHDTLMKELEAMNDQVAQYKEELLTFIEKVM